MDWVLIKRVGSKGPLEPAVWTANDKGCSRWPRPHNRVASHTRRPRPALTWVLEGALRLGGAARGVRVAGRARGRRERGPGRRREGRARRLLEGVGVGSVVWHERLAVQGGAAELGQEAELRVELAVSGYQHGRQHWGSKNRCIRSSARRPEHRVDAGCCCLSTRAATSPSFCGLLVACPRWSHLSSKGELGNQAKARVSLLAANLGKG